MRPATLLLLGAVLLITPPAGADGPVTQQQLTASPAPGARFGSAVAISETVLAVGAYLDGGGNGAVYVYRRNPNDGTWGFPTRLQGAQGEQLGYSVAIDDTAQTLIAGAPFAPGGGAVYRYPLADLTRETLILPHLAGAEIGCAVAAASGIVAIGACGKGGTGGVYLLEKLEGDGDALLELDLPVAPGDRAGTAVALSPDGRTVVAGAPLHAGTGPAAGAAYVSSRRPDGIWSPPVPLPATPRAEDAFGYGVATDGTFIAVGAPLDDAQGQDAGAVYVFRKSGGGWSPMRKVTTGAAGDQLGVSVALDGATILAGARRHGPARHAGAAYLISVDGTMGNPLLAQPQSAGAELGFAVALRGDTALAGAFLANAERGAAYVFAPSVQIVADPPLQAPKSQAVLPLPVSIVTADGQPTRSPITVDLNCSGPAASHLVCPPQVVFLPVSTNGARQRATVTLVDPSAAAGDLSFTVTLTSPVGAFLGAPAAADATFKDTLSPSIVVDSTSLVTCEGCPPVSFTVRLATQPTADVTVSLANADPTQVTVSASSIRFTSGAQGSWSVPQTVTVTAVDDPVPEADAAYPIRLTAPDLSPVTVSVEVLDNDQVTGIERACSLGPGEILFTFVLTDHGAAQTEVDLTDALPADLLTVYAAAADAGAATLDPITNAVTWRTPLSSAAPATLTLVAAVVPGTDGRIVSDQATFVFDGTANTTDDPDSPLPHTANRATIWKLGDTAHPLPACPSPPE